MSELSEKVRVLRKFGLHASADALERKDRPCTCHPDDNPPTPCPHKYALIECRDAAGVMAFGAPSSYVNAARILASDMPATVVQKLDAAAGVGGMQPTAWRVRGYDQFKTGKPGPWRYFDGAERPTVNNPEGCDIEPLYGTPGVAPCAELQQEKTMPYTVIESVELTDTQWGVSLTGPNPDAADYYACTSKEHAFRLLDALRTAGVPEVVADHTHSDYADGFDAGVEVGAQQFRDFLAHYAPVYVKDIRQWHRDFLAARNAGVGGDANG